MSSITPTDALRAKFGPIVLAVENFREECSIQVAPDSIRLVCQWCRDNGYEMLSDLFGVDHFGEQPRFEVVYLLSSLRAGYLRLKARISEAEPTLPSVVSVWPGANWHERETFDMYGIRFQDHPDLKRILMWPGYPHHPLRKDFPLAGIPADLPLEADTSAGRAEHAPMAGGPFVAGMATAASATTPDGRPSTIQREPRQYDSAAEQLVKLRNPVHKEVV